VASPLPQAWWGDAGPGPGRIALRALLDGAPVGREVGCELKRLQPHKESPHAARTVLAFDATVPLPLGCRVTRLRKAGPAALELHAVSEGAGGPVVAASQAAAAPSAVVTPVTPPATPAAAAVTAAVAVVAAAAASAAREAAHAAPFLAPPVAQAAAQAGPQPGAQAGTEQLEPARDKKKSKKNKRRRQEQEEQQEQQAQAQEQGQQQTQVQQQSQQQAQVQQQEPARKKKKSKSKGGQPSQPAQQQQTQTQAAAPAGRGPSSGPARAAAPAALPRLAEIVLPPPGAPDEPGALEAASFTAYSEVERAAEALGLAPAEVDAVCRAVEAKTRAPEAARRFVRMEFRQLWRACAHGEAGLARTWMARLAAGAGGGGGSGGSGGGA
jgi:hypothetical protein